MGELLFWSYFAKKYEPFGESRIQFRESDTFQAWLYAIERNIAIDHIRKQVKYAKTSVDDLEILVLEEALLESLTQYFNVSPQEIANYIGIGVDELLSFENSLRKDMIEKNIAHLFNAFVRGPCFS